jgi:hypothetical protein
MEFWRGKIHHKRHTGESRYQDIRWLQKHWTPAFAKATTFYEVIIIVRRRNLRYFFLWIEYRADLPR